MDDKFYYDILEFFYSEPTKSNDCYFVSRVEENFKVQFKIINNNEVEIKIFFMFDDKENLLYKKGIKNIHRVYTIKNIFNIDYNEMNETKKMSILWNTYPIIHV